MDTGRYAGLTDHQFEEFVTGAAGAGHYAFQSGRTDWQDNSTSQGFALVEVNGASFNVSVYEQGNTTPVFTKSFTK